MRAPMLTQLRDRLGEQLLDRMDDRLHGSKQLSWPPRELLRYQLDRALGKAPKNSGTE